jgi:hypothetical protein
MRSSVKPILKDLGVILLMAALLLAIFWSGYESAIMYIKVIGGCGRLGMLQPYCGDDGTGSFAVPGSFMILPIALAFLLPPFIAKFIVGRWYGRLSWKKLMLLYLFSLPLAFVAYSVVASLAYPHHGV